MIPIQVWKLLHLFFSFGFVGTLVLADWNGRAARRAQSWSERATLFEILQTASRVAGFGSLLLLGGFGNVLSIQLGYRMAADGWLRWANGLWLAAVVVMIALVLPSLSKLAAAARSAAQGGEAAGYEHWMARWRFGNAVLSLLYLASLMLMVFRSRP